VGAAKKVKLKTTCQRTWTDEDIAADLKRWTIEERSVRPDMPAVRQECR
jgi:hypothetical protein